MLDFTNKAECEEARKRRGDELRRLSFLPVVLYGAGVYAKELAEFLASINIPVSDYVVDGAFVSRAHVTEKAPISFSALASKYHDVNILIAYQADPETTSRTLREKGPACIRRIDTVDCRSWKQFEILNAQKLEDDKGKYYQVMNWLQDDVSKSVFREYILAKLLYDSSELRKLKSMRQYFPNDLPWFQVEPDDVVVDAGAFTGDTLAELVDVSNGRGCRKYYAFEPSHENLVKLREFVDKQQLVYASVVASGLWNEATQLSFKEGDGSASTVASDGEITIPVVTLDSLDIPATFIKMDIEGSEQRALLGAKETISRLRPNLAICLYHKPEDLLDIPVLIKSLCSEYRLYLRIHSFWSEELVLYATVRE